jgi:hypothetical protein
MQKIPLILARDGMILAKEIVHPDKSNGPPLFGKGLRLSAAHIERLANIGIQAVVVEGRPVVMEGDAGLDDQLKSLEDRFVRCGQDPFMQQLKAALQRHITRMLGE